LREHLGEGLYRPRHILWFDCEHHHVGALNRFAIVGGDVHAELVGQRDATLMFVAGSPRATNPRISAPPMFPPPMNAAVMSMYVPIRF
jgi:hypothetical protein